MNSANRTPINHCQIPPWLLADVAFQESPLMIAIGDVQKSEGRLWRELQELENAEERRWHFHEHLCEKFSLHAWRGATTTRDAASAHGYVHVIRAACADRDGASAAALKAWVESRFGLSPLYHGGWLTKNEEAKRRFLRDRFAGTAQTAGLFQQLDLLYTFAQEELQRQNASTRWLMLYRGFDHPEDGTPARMRDGRYHVELNNLNSLFAERELGWGFGVTGWEVRVPFTKILYFPGLLPEEILRGVRDHLVIGGHYLMRKATI